MTSKRSPKTAVGWTNVPEGWQLVRLGDVAEINRENWSPDGNGTILYLNLTAVTSPGRLDAPREVDSPNAPSRARRRVRSGDILVSTVRPNLRGFARVRKAASNLVASTGFAVLTPKATADGSFLYRHILSPDFARTLESSMTGQAYPAVRPDDVTAYRLLLPPLPEQQAIAAVLDSIDEAIERTETVIAATEQLRDSLLHELLTRGVPGWHTEWKEVPGLGTTPADWEVVRLGDVGQWFSGGTPAKSREDYWQGSIPWVSPKDMKTREIYDSEDHITEEGARAGSRVIPAGTILVVVRGMILAHSFPLAVSRVAVAFNQDIRGLVCSDAILPDFILAALEYQTPRLRQLPTPSTHGTMRVVSEELLATPVPIPALPEQRIIANTFHDIGSTIRTDRLKADKLRALKLATADTLLAGRKLVT